MTSVLQAIYQLRANAHSIGERAHAIAVEQSVEMPVAAIDDRYVHDEVAELEADPAITAFLRGASR